MAFSAKAAASGCKTLGSTIFLPACTACSPLLPTRHAAISPAITLISLTIARNASSDSLTRRHERVPARDSVSQQSAHSTRRATRRSATTRAPLHAHARRNHAHRLRTAGHHPDAARRRAALPGALPPATVRRRRVGLRLLLALQVLRQRGMMMFTLLLGLCAARALTGRS